MDPISQKKQRRAAILDELKTYSKAAQLSARAFSDEERTKIEALKAENEKLAAEIKTAEADEETRKYVESLSSELEVSEGRKTQPDKLGTVGNPREAALEDPKKGFKTPREYLSAVIDAGRGRGVDKRLHSLAVGSDEARGNSDPAGGFLVPEGFSPDMLKIEAEADPIGGATRKIPMATTILKIPARVDKNHSTSVSGGLTVTRRPETVAAGSSQMTFEQVAMEAHNLFGLSYATEEILVDSPISFAALLAAGFSDQFTGHLIKERIRGTGIGEFMGVLNSPCLVTVSKEVGQAADTIAYENVIKMRSRVWGYGKAIWLANHDTLPQLMLMNHAVGTGGVPIWQPSGREDHPDMLLGRPLIFTEYASTVGDVGDLICGNFGEYLEGTYQPLQSAESMHVRFINHERTFKFWLRNAGQPWWKSALTPQNSASTLSPFVVLEAR